MEKKHMVKHVILWTLKNEYSKEEMALIDSMSIEEAYRKGLI